MDPNVNPLSNITNLKVRHMVMQILAFMWSGVFSLYIVDSIFVFGITSIAHVLLLLQFSLLLLFLIQQKTDLIFTI